LPVTSRESARILVSMAEKEEFREDPLEQLLDEETDEEFGLPEFKEHFADTLTPAVLKDWTAADFASIYVRFRPHLERHARRFLVNPSQVEEVVQDAFLYLMTTLPELDSELGVLKFLKWKVRLLCLDVIRINSRASFAPLEDQPEMAANSPELSQSMERADDAAIVALALAKLQPRHREVLIASIYEEKATDVVAAQMGLSENATRQLLFRARSAFKKALIGEADTAGLSVGQILSLAARKAAAESGKYISAAGAFLLVLAISVGIIPNLAQPVAPVAEPTQSQPAEEPEVLVEEGATEEEVVVEVPVQVVVPVEQVAAPVAEAVAAPEPIFSEFSLSSILATDVSQAGYYTNSYASSDFLSAGFRASSIEIFGGTGISAFLDIDFANRSVYNVVFQMWVDGKRYYAVAENASAVTNSVVGGYEVIHRSSEFWVVDDKGNVFDQSPLANATAVVTLTLDSNGNPVKAAMQVQKAS
jgi:RNA polymerase sigma factor (sigma-70 family)